MNFAHNAIEASVRILRGERKQSLVKVLQVPVPSWHVWFRILFVFLPL